MSLRIKSLIFCFKKCCVGMSERPNRLRGGRETSTRSARSEKAVARLHHGRRRQGSTRIRRSDEADATTSKAIASQIVDPTQHQHQHDAYQPQYEQAKQQKGEAQQQAQ